MSALYAKATKLVACAMPFATILVASVSYAAFTPIELPALPSEPLRGTAQVYLATPPSMSRMVGAKIAPEVFDLEPTIIVGRVPPPPQDDVVEKNWVCIRQNLIVGRLAKDVRAASTSTVWACEWRAPSERP
jgi:hypothetical protein